VALKRRPSSPDGVGLKLVAPSVRHLGAVGIAVPVDDGAELKISSSADERVREVGSNPPLMTGVEFELGSTSARVRAFGK
jgi:hypothetical protein